MEGFDSGRTHASTSAQVRARLPSPLRCPPQLTLSENAADLQSSDGRHSITAYLFRHIPADLKQRHLVASTSDLATPRTMRAAISLNVGSSAQVRHTAPFEAYILQDGAGRMR